jgi:hypothetical protein
VQIESSGTDAKVSLVTSSGSSGQGFIQASAGALLLGSSNTERARIDASGNLGLGVTPSAWGGGFKAFETNGTSLGSNATGSSYYLQNSYFNGTNFIYTTTAAASYYQQITGAHRWYTAASGTAGNTITFTQAMTLDASGNLGIGTTSPAYKLDVTGTMGVSGVSTLTGGAVVQGMTVGRGTGAIATNIAVGVNALNVNTSGASNTAVGYQALLANTTGTYGSGFGQYALFSNTTGTYNTALGMSSLFSNTIANNNTAAGYQSAYNTTTAVATLGAITGGTGGTDGTYTGVVMTLSSGSTATTYPTATIVVAGGTVTTVTLTNTGVGFKDTTTVLTAPTASIGNVTGFSVLVATLASGANNTAVGYQAGYNNKTASFNTFLGDRAGLATTTGSEVVAVGSFALGSNTTGNYNIAIGRQALNGNTTASNSTAVGWQAGYTNQTGQYNTFIGSQAGYSHLSAGSCTFVGTSAGFSSTGISNTFVGINSGTSMTTGTKNTILGSYSGNSGGLDIRTSNSYIVLSDGDGNPRGFFDNNGNFVVNRTSTLFTAKQTLGFSGLTSNGFSIDDTNGTASSVGYVYFARAGTSVGSISYASGVGLISYNTTSDYRAKTVNGIIQNALSKVALLKPSTGRMNSAEQDIDFFVAHELQEVVPSAVTGEKDAVNEDSTPKYQMVDKSALIPLLTAAIQEQQAIIESLKARLDAANL